MPKTPPRDKPNRPALGRGTGNHSRKPLSVGELLSKQPATRAVRAALDAEQQWLARLREQLPAELAARLAGAVERRGTLTVYATSAAWCTRLKYALAGTLAPLQAAAPQLRALQVRVRPPGKGAGPRGD